MRARVRLCVCVCVSKLRLSCYFGDGDESHGLCVESFASHVSVVLG